MDSAKGDEGLTLALFDQGPVGLMVRDGDRRLYLGTAPGGSFLTNIPEPFHGLLLKNGADVVHQINVASKK